MGLIDGTLTVLGAAAGFGKDALENHANHNAAELNSTMYDKMQTAAYARGDNITWEQIASQTGREIWKEMTKESTFYSSKFRTPGGCISDYTNFVLALIEQEKIKRAHEAGVISIGVDYTKCINGNFPRFKQIFPPNEDEYALWLHSEWQHNIPRMKQIKHLLTKEMVAFDLFDNVLPQAYKECIPNLELLKIVQERIIYPALNDYFEIPNLIENIKIKEQCRIAKEEKILDAVFGGYEISFRGMRFYSEKLKIEHYKNEEESQYWKEALKVKKKALSQYFEKQSDLKHHHQEYDKLFYKTYKQAIKR